MNFLIEFSFYLLVIIKFIPWNQDRNTDPWLTEMGQSHSESLVILPASLDDLKAEVRMAKLRGQKICLQGSGMSQNGQNTIGSFQPFVIIKLDLMNSVSIDKDKEVAVVRGNVPFREMEAEANRFGLATKVRQASGIFGILSSIATNVHGWDHKTGCIGNTVNWVKALDSDGTEKLIRQGSELFPSIVGSFGGFFLIYEAEIQLTRNVLLRKETNGPFESISDVLGHFKLRSQEADMGLIRVGKNQFYTMLFTPILKESGQVSTKLNLEGPQGPYFERLLVDISRTLICFRLQWILDWFYEKVLERTWTQPETSLRNEFMNVNVLAIRKNLNGIFFSHKFFLVEYFVKENDLADLIDLYRQEYKSVFVYNASIRFVPLYNGTYAPYARTDVFALVICWDQVMTKTELETSRERNLKFLDFLKRRGGTFYLAYENTAQDIALFYPEFVSQCKTQCSIFSNGMIEMIQQME